MCSAKEIQECYQRADEARQIASGTADPATKKDFKEIERRWLSLARNCSCGDPSNTKLGKSPPRATRKRVGARRGR